MAVFEREVRVGDRGLAVSGLFYEMQEAAAEQSRLLGWGYEDMKAHGVMWVVTRYQLLLRRWPEPGETVRVLTWPGETRHGMYLRYFRVTEGEELLIEGAMRDILTNKYERNRKARARCIAHYGTACQICGMDFGAFYGEAFAGKIEVHHRKPLYEIQEDYVVDPIKDLIPVCPNCHLILHSKKDGVYSVEEVKHMLHF